MARVEVTDSITSWHRPQKGQIFVRSFGRNYLEITIERKGSNHHLEIHGMWTQPTLGRATGYGRPSGDSRIGYGKAVKRKIKRTICSQAWIREERGRVSSWE